MKRASFPHLGAVYAYLAPYLRSLGLDVVVPPFSSRRTLDLGVRHCPEMICGPCKIMFGNYVEALEAGTEALIMFGGPGTCRLGYSARYQQQVLGEWGYMFEAHTFDLRHTGPELIHVTRALADPSPRDLVRALRFLVALVNLSDDVERDALRLRPRELERGTATRLRAEALSQVSVLRTRREVSRRRRAILRPFRQAAQDRRRPVLRVGLVGDLYSMSEPFFNLNLEQELGYLGVEVDRWLWVSRYLQIRPLLKLLRRDSKAKAQRAGRPYLAHDIGGFARSTIGHAVLFARSGYDGLIHLAPLNCTPEVMADNILVSHRRDVGIPILSLSFDEQTSQAGLLTRLEAFTDLLWRGKRDG